MEPLQVVLAIVLPVVIIAAVVHFYMLFYRMMADVHRIAEALDPEGDKVRDSLGEQIMSQKVRRESKFV